MNKYQTVTVERDSTEHQAIQALGMINFDGDTMKGIKNVSRLPRWKNWQGYYYSEFQIGLTEESLNQIWAYVNKYTDDYENYETFKLAIAE